jgi:hypothetical protein
MMNTRTMFCVSAALFLGLARLAVGQSGAYDLSWNTTAGGGGTSAGSGFELAATIGQPGTGVQMAGGSFSLTGGFWSSPGASIIVPPDFDRDGDVDLDDFAVFRACFSGPAVAYTGDCAKADFDHNGNVDQADFGIFQRCYSGANNPANPNCAN